jgi:asparaginyl-tRNA synthetase
LIQHESVESVLRSEAPGRTVTVYGWIRTARTGKNVVFAELNDGSCSAGLQVVFDRDSFDQADMSGLSTGACIAVTGQLVESPGSEQSVELSAKSFTLVGPVDGEYPLQKKRHSIEFLRTIPHLRPRTNTFGNVFRVRHQLCMAIHGFFDEHGFYYVHPPLITASDAEGAGETFSVTTLPLESVPVAGEGGVDFGRDFFGERAYLSVSAQLEAEPLALALGKVYTFGPTFRADPSDTRVHAAEFWMIEPEMAFYDLDDSIALMEEFVRYTAAYIRERCPDELDFFGRFYEHELEERYSVVLDRPFRRVRYHDAFDILEENASRFETPPERGRDLSSEQERFLAGEVFGGPLFVTDYPASLKPFYMRLNDDGETVACTDLLFPGVGEIIGGSQREERLDILVGRMKGHGMDMDIYRWYTELRRWGTAPHSGFGLGLERLLMYFTGIDNIRDVIPFPRTAGRMI